MDKVYQDMDIRYFAAHCPTISMTFLNTGNLMPGQVIGEMSDGYANKVRRTTLSSDAAAAATELFVADISLFQIGDTIALRKADSSEIENLGAVKSIIAEEHKLVVTTALMAAHPTGTYIYVADGSEKAVAILAEPVIDFSEAVTANVYLGGCFIASSISGMDAVAKSDLGARVVSDILIVPV